jgi:polysaccharide export outer membrane protein
MLGVTCNLAFAQDTSYKIQPADVLSITVHQQPDLTTKARVSNDGYISFPLLGKVEIKGLTVQETEDKIKTLLEKDYLVSAQVIVFIEEYHPRQVSVMGEVTKPGKYNMPEEKEMTLLQAVAMAEGFTKDADIKGIKIMRAENGEQVTIKVNAKETTVNGQKDILLKPDDIIFVPESFF